MSKSFKNRLLKINLTSVLLLLGVTAGLVWYSLPVVQGQDATNPTPTPAATNSAASATNAPARIGADTNAVASSGSSTNAATGATNAPPEEPKKLPTDLIEISFQNMQIDQVVQWLSENTGKSVVKFPTAHCQITIVSTKKVTRQEAVTMIYRALAMEGFTAIESSKSILIVPDDKEPKLSPEVMGAMDAGAPGGRERLLKVFHLQHLPAADLSEKIKSVLSKDATVMTDDRANLMIVTDYYDNLAAANALIKALDVEKDDDVIVRVINLHTMNAQDLAKQLQPLYQKLTGKQTKELIEVSANDTANSLMVLSSGANFKEIQKFALSLDTTNATERIERTFLLTNADAQDVTKQLQDLDKDPDSDSPYRIFYYGGNPNGKDTKRISIVADRRRNAILVDAPPSAMETLAKTIAALDAPIQDNSLAPQIVPLQNVSAGDIEDVLNELFLKKTTQRSYYDDYYNPQPQADRDVGRLYGKVRITSEAANNALIITANSQENLDAVIAIVKQLDKPSAAGDTTFHVKLNFGNAQKIANRINILFAKNGSQALRPNNQPNANGGQNTPPPQPQQGTQTAPAADDFSLEQVIKEDPYYSWLGGPPDNSGRNGSTDRPTDRPVSDLVGRVRVVPDEASSSLLVTANINLFAQVSKMIEQMDVPPPQVLIEARLVQVSADYLDAMGVRYSPDGNQFTGNDLQNSLTAQVAGTYQKGFGGNTAVNTPNNSAASVAQALTQLRSGVLQNSISLNFLIQFLHQKADATVIAEPQLTISDNDLGKLFVGKSIPILTGTVNPSIGGGSSTFTYRNVGIIIEVEPHINDDGDVALRVRAESSTIDPASNQTNVVIDSAQFRTELTAKQGETLVMGGIIQKQYSDTSYRTPVLGYIPGFKYLFGKQGKTGQRTELLVFLKPKVVRTKEQAREMLDEVNAKHPLIQKSNEEEKQKESIIEKGMK